VTFDEWAERDLRPLLGFAAVLCGSRHLAEDVVQEALIKAHKHWSKVQKADNPDAYLRRMVVNEFLTWRRKWARIVPRAEVGADSTVGDHAERHAEYDETLRRIAKLPRRQRTVLVLRYYGNQTDREIAETLGCSVGTVRGYAARALAALRQELTGSKLKRGTSTATNDTGATHAH
jgi:RNA polymerase sigma-70 factor (sigma-E family)